MVGFHSDTGFTTGGTSLFIVKLANDYDFPESADPFIYSVLNVEVLENNPDISIYPNPFTEAILVDNESVVERIEVMDLTGKQVFVSQVSVTSIDTSSWQKGTYIIRCQSGGKWYSKKLVKF